MRGLFLPDFFSQFGKFTEDENQLKYSRWSFNINRPLSSSSDASIPSFSFSSSSCRSNIRTPIPPPFFPRSNYQSPSIIPYMNLPSNSPLLPSVVLNFSGSREAHIAISSPASPFLFPPRSISSALASPSLPFCFLAPLGIT